MTRAPLVIVGGGGHAKVCIEVLRAQGLYEPIACVDPKAAGGDVLGVPIVGGDESLPRLLAEGSTHAFVAIGSNALRERISKALLADGFELPAAVDPFTRVSPSARLGRGVLVMPGAIINAEAAVSDFAIINSGAVVEHDCRIGQAAHVGPGAVLAGCVTVGDRAFLGAGVKVRDGMSICADAIVGTGGSVVADIPLPGVFVGVPTRRLEGRSS